MEHTVKKLLAKGKKKLKNSYKYLKYNKFSFSRPTNIFEIYLQLEVNFYLKI